MSGKEALLNDLLKSYRFPEPIYVTRPSMPPLSDYTRYLEGIWERKWLTNEGDLHRQFEAELCNRLGVKHLSLFCNGTIALLVALQALRINSGEVITTPFTFPATPHVLWWNRVRPVFCDIDPTTLNIDPKKIERLIGPETRAILPVHTYGSPCDVEVIQRIADTHGLKVIYDAAHAFGIRYKGRSILEHGDMSMLSFHATKLFSTIEGGALMSNSKEQKQRVDYLKNFGIVDEETVIGPGINGKMNEFQAAYGLLQLKMVDEEVQERRLLTLAYREGLRNIPGITFWEDAPDVESNYAYFPILIDSDRYGMSRDSLNSDLKAFNVYTRKYFYPLCSQFPCYSDLPSSNSLNLPVSERVASEVLCLPIYGALEERNVKIIADIIKHLAAI